MRPLERIIINTSLTSGLTFSLSPADLDTDMSDILLYYKPYYNGSPQVLSTYSGLQ